MKIGDFFRLFIARSPYFIFAIHGFFPQKSTRAIKRKKITKKNQESMYINLNVIELEIAENFSLLFDIS